MNRFYFGKLGVVSGFVALGVVLFHFWLGPFGQSAPTLEELAGTKAAQIKKSFAAAIKGETPIANNKTPSLNVDKVIRLSSIVFAFLALVLAAVSYLNKEDPRYSAVGVVVAGSSLAFHFLLVAAGIVIVLVLIAALLGNPN